MSVLILGLYPEGPTDARFLPIVMQRTAERLLSLRGLRVTDVLDVAVVRPRALRRAEAIVEAAGLAFGCHALFVHADANARAPARALSERIEPGLSLLGQSAEPACKITVPLVPVQATEAWLLADAAALCAVIGTDIDQTELGLPTSAAGVEAIARPKDALDDAVRKALAVRPRRRRLLVLGQLYEPVARRLRLERLSQLPSFLRFEGLMAQALVELGLIE